MPEGTGALVTPPDYLSRPKKATELWFEKRKRLDQLRRDVRASEGRQYWSERQKAAREWREKAEAALLAVFTKK